MERKNGVDDRDIFILNELQLDARQTSAQISQKMGTLTPQAVGERIKRLRERDIIRRFTISLDFRQLDFNIMAYIFVMVDAKTDAAHYHEKDDEAPPFSQFAKAVAKIPNVVELSAITGESTHCVKVYAKNTEGLEGVLNIIQKIPSVLKTVTSVALRTAKCDGPLPLDLETNHVTAVKRTATKRKPKRKAAK